MGSDKDAINANSSVSIEKSEVGITTVQIKMSSATVEGNNNHKRKLSQINEVIIDLKGFNSNQSSLSNIIPPKVKVEEKMIAK